MKHESAEFVGLPRDDAKRRAIDLYRTTRLSVDTIATQVGVSRMTVYRWLHRAGVSLGRDAMHDDSGSGTQDLSGITDAIADLRRQHADLLGQVGRLHGLIEVLIGLQTQPVAHPC
jgi:transposase-like protein